MTGQAPQGLKRLSLVDFRSYPQVSVETQARCCALIGDNGAGKTNLLEAISLFTPGRGLRRIEWAAMARQNGAGGFAVALELTQGEDGLDGRRLGVGLLPADGEGRRQRQSRIDGTEAGSAAAFAEHIRVVWLTPDMDGLFRGAAGDRRRFLDRLVLGVDAAHAARTNALERALRQRNRILEDHAHDHAWLDATEREIAACGIAVASARALTVARLSSLISERRGEASPFPAAGLALAGDIDRLLAEHGPEDGEERYRQLLRATRARDRAAGRTLLGPQASELMVRHLDRDIAAAQGSTGEQKALLIALILAQARLIRRVSGIAPLLLLDEVAAHLDPRRRAALYREVDDIGGQVWMTGTEASLFADLAAGSDRFLVAGGMITRL